MQSKPFFSIVTPCWNSATTIERTIKSILIQEFKDYEYIIVDGGSTDGTLDIIKAYEPLFEGRLKWKSERDNGLYDAFNKGVVSSNGVYCWNVNSDDFIEPTALLTIYNYIKKCCLGNNPVISGAMNFISQGGKLIKVQKCNYQRLEHAYKNDYIGLNHPATLVPKEIYDKYGAFDPYYKIIGDVDWFHRIYKAGVNIVIIDDVIINMADGGVSNLFVYRRSLRDRLYFLRKNYNSRAVRIWHLLKWTKSFFMTKISHKLKSRR